MGIIYWELLPPNTSVTASLYCAQLDHVRQALMHKRFKGLEETGKVRLLVDNAKPHIAKSTREHIEKFRWEMMPHPAYSPDLSPTDFHLFRSLSFHLRGKKFDEQEELKNEIDTFFKSKNQEFYAEGIMNLPRRWEHVCDNDGQYFT